MNARAFQRLVQLGLVVLVIAGAWQLTRNPAIGVALLIPVGLAALAHLRTRLSTAQLISAAQRNDVAALEACATRGSILIRGQALVAFIHHGGFEKDELRTLCMCGTCEKDALDKELDVVRQALRLAWTGHPHDGLSLAIKEEGFAPTLSPLMHQWVGEVRAISTSFCILLSARSDEEPPGKAFDDLVAQLAQGWPALRWPFRLALATAAATRGNRVAARAHLAGMPAWPEHSRLERARRELVTSLG